MLFRKRNFTLWLLSCLALFPMTKKTIYPILTALIFSTGQLIAGPIDLSTWQKEGPASNGNWVVSGDASSVVQTINGNPTFFVSPDYFLNSSFEGEFRVQTTADDDYIGFVLFSGTSHLDPFYLFDWKQTPQSGSDRGFYFSRVTGGASAIPFANHHLNATGYEVLATDLGLGKGWADNTTYGFLLNYTASNITIGISGGAFGAGTTIFDLDGNYEAARFGFYNYSQQNVLYQGFTEETINVPEAASTWWLILACFGAAAIGRRSLRRT